MLPKNSAARKAVPLARGCLFYFPDALAAVAEVSRKGNDKHNPGEPIRWSREKSDDHADCIARHLIDAGPEWTEIDPDDDVLHAVKVAWRALALAQIAIEKQRAAVKPGPEWIDWKGGPRPVDGSAFVYYIIGGKDDRVRGPCAACNIRWKWVTGGDYNDIVAYRVVP